MAVKAAKRVPPALKRVQFDLPPDVVDDINELKQWMGAGTQKEVIRGVVRLMKRLYQARSEGGDVVVERGENREPVMLP